MITCESHVNNVSLLANVLEQIGDCSVFRGIPVTIIHDCILFFFLFFLLIHFCYMS
jgi:hypothetical protein